MSHSHEIQARSGQLIEYSNKVYEVIDQPVEGQSRARQIMRRGLQVIAHVAREASIKEAGRAATRVLHDSLQAGGITPADTAAWPKYNAFVTNLPDCSLNDTFQPNEVLDAFAMQYADTPRRTVARDGSYETDGTHVVHLAALAIPYALEHHPELHPGKVATYAFGHDRAETFAGDTATLGASEATLLDKDRREHEAEQLIRLTFGEQFPEFVKAGEEYNTLEDKESRYVKTFDKLEPKFTYGHSEGINIRRDYGYTHEEYEKLSALQRKKMRSSYGKEFEDILAIHSFITAYFMDRIPWDEKIPT